MRGPKISFVARVVSNPNTLIAAVYIVIVALVMPYLCSNLSFSLYYNPPRDIYDKILAANKQRANAAKDLLENSNFSDLFARLDQKSPEFCIVVVSIKRPRSTWYLTQVVARLLPQIVNDQGVTFTVFNAHGAEHMEADNLASSIPVMTNPHSSHDQGYDKQRQDFIFCFEWCLKREPQFTIVLEDDALPPHDFMERLRFVLDHRMPKKSEVWAFVKLFYPEKYQGWAVDLNIVAELVGSSFFGGLLLTGFSLCVTSAFSSPKQFCSFSIVFRLAMSITFVVCMLVSFGRPHILELRKANMHLSSVVQAPGCCTPAVVYANTHLQELVDYLKSIQCSPANPVDIAVDTFVKERGLQEWLVVPNMVTHIGLVSSFTNKGWKKHREFGLIFDP